MTNKKLELLIVEDNPQHMQDAIAEMGRRITAGAPIGYELASNLKEALSKTNSKEFDGIISDIFYPSGSGLEEETRYRWSTLAILAEVEVNPTRRDVSWIEDMEINAPLGVYLWNAIKEKFPKAFVYCTDSNHHAQLTQAVYEYSRRYRIPLVDKEPYEEGGKKYWSRAYIITALQNLGSDLRKESSEIKKEEFYENLKSRVKKFTLPEDAYDIGNESRRVGNLLYTPRFFRV